MRAFVITGPRQTAVEDVARPAAAPGQAVIDVELAGVCGTDVEFFTGEMAYLHQGHAKYPVRPGHEWCGTVAAVGEGVDPAWVGRRVTGDTMLGCGRCRRCRAGLHYVCADRAEIGIRGGRPGALAEQVAVPAVALRELPDSVDAVAGALAEPGGSGPWSRPLLVSAMWAACSRERARPGRAPARRSSSTRAAEQPARSWSAEVAALANGPDIIRNPEYDHEELQQNSVNCDDYQEEQRS
jgi:Alcohol dehydrogenase GroES-like domain